MERELDAKAQSLTTLRSDFELAAASDGGVLITGDLGPAETLARIIHAASSRRRGRFLSAVGGENGNIAALALLGLPDTLFVTDADSLTQSDQERLLDRCHHLSSVESSSLHPRIICADTGNLFNRVKQGTFDSRLLYLLNVIHIRLPPHIQPDDVRVLPSSESAETGKRSLLDIPKTLAPRSEYALTPAVRGMFFSKSPT